LLPTVYAYSDYGWMNEKTRWKPRRVFCTIRSDHADKPGDLFVVKFLQEQQGAAALISEVVCTSLFRFAGIPTLEPVIVSASDNFAASYRGKSGLPYTVLKGKHFGTAHRGDVEAGPPLSYDEVAEPVQLIRLWVFDTWVSDIDREIQGNILLALSGSGFKIIAADQSDCFCGSKNFCSREFTKLMSRAGTASSVRFLPTVIQRNGGPTAIRSAIKEVHDCMKHIATVLALVPSSWWRISRIDPSHVEQALISRAQRLEDILKPSQWGGFDASQAILL
jgi:hypothetical protein